MSQNAPPTVHKSVLITQLIAATVMVGVPILITLVAPITHITVQADPQGTTVTTQKRLLMVVPFRTETITPLTTVTEKLVKGHKYTPSEQRRGHKGGTVDDGTMYLEGGGKTITVQVSADRLKQISQEIRDFMASPRTAPWQATVPAHWLISNVVGGIATFCAGFYVVCAVLGSFQWLIRKLGPHQPDRTADDHASGETMV